MTWNKKQTANRFYARIVRGDTKRTNIDINKYKDYLTKEQLKEIKKITDKNKKECAKNGCRSDKGKPRKPKDPDTSNDKPADKPADKPVDKPADKSNAKATNKFEKSKYTLDFVKQTLINNPNDKIKESTKQKHKNTIGGIFQLFNVNNFVDIFEKHSKENILKTITDKYASPLTQIGVINILIQDLLPEVGHHLGKETVDFFKFSKEPLKGKKHLEEFNARKEDNTDYESLYDKLMKREKELGKKDPGGMLHLIAVLHTLGIFDENKEIKMVPRGYYKKVHIVEDDKDVNNTGNFYVKKSGKIIMNEFKTSNHFNFNYKVSKEVKGIIDMSLKRLPRKYLVSDKNGEALSDNMYWRLVGSGIGMANREYRKTIENTLMKKGYDRVKLAGAMGHSIITAQKSYLAQNGK